MKKTITDIEESRFDPRYILKHHAGSRLSRRNRRTKTTVTLYHAEEAHLDPDGGPYVTVCEQHGNLVNHDTYALARDWMTAPEDWCPDCAELELLKP